MLSSNNLLWFCSYDIKQVLLYILHCYKVIPLVNNATVDKYDIIPKYVAWRNVSMRKHQHENKMYIVRYVKRSKSYQLVKQQNV